MFRAILLRLAMPLLALLALPAEGAGGGDGDGLPAAEPQAEAELEALAASQPPATASPEERCVLVHRRGSALLKLGRYERAIADLRQALALERPGAASPGLWCGRWAIQGDLSLALYSAGDWLALAEFATAVAEEYRPRNDWRYYVAQTWLIDPQVYLGDLAAAGESFARSERLLAELRRAQALPEHGAILLSRHSTYAAWLEELRGNYAAAEGLRRQALKPAEDYRAFVRANRAPDHYEVRVAVLGLASRKRQLAALLAIRGKIGEAELLARQALRETLSLGGRDTLHTAFALDTLGRIELVQGRVGASLNVQQQALTVMERSGVRPYSTALARQRAEVALLLAMQDRLDEALALYARRDEALRGHPAQFARTGSGTIDWAMALVRRAQPEAGEKMLRRILDHNLAKPFVDPLYLAYIRGYLGTALLATGKGEAALAEFRTALPTLAQQAAADSAAEDGAFVRQYRLRLIAAAYLELLSRLAAGKASPPGFDATAEAFRVAELARGSRVQQAIARSAARATLPDAALESLARREQDAANQSGALGKRLAQLAAAPAGRRRDEAIRDIRREAAALDKELASLRRQLAKGYPAYAELVAPSPPSPAELQAALHADEAVVAIYVAENRAHVWTLAPGRLSFRSAEIGRRQLEQQVARLREAFDFERQPLPPFDSATALQLYRLLLAPDAALWAKARVLNVVTHGVLGQLPFSVLLRSPAEGERPADWPWLANSVAIAQQPSAGSLLALRRAEGARELSRRPFVGFGDPLFHANDAAGAAPRALRRVAAVGAGDRTGSAETLSALLAQGFAQLPALPDTREELQEIGRSLAADPASDLYLGARASEANVKGANLAGYRVLAFATHGLVPGELAGLDQPSLALSNPALSGDEANDGFLTLGEVMGLKLDAEWVVLSACNTASSDGRNEEALSGLGRAFFFAGSRRLLVSYWPVETVSARLLTTRLFQRLAGHPAETKAEALRHAMRALMKTRPEYGHPAYWAAFGVVGDGGR